MDHYSLIGDTLRTLGSHFEANELAYLALTGKFEAAIRDKLAFQLHQEKALEQLVVCREWRKVDLAILSIDKDKGANAEVFLQVKVKSSTFKLITEAEKARVDAQEDTDKCMRKSSGTARVYTLLVAPHIENDWNPGRKFESVLKYRWRPVSEVEVNEAVDQAFKEWRIEGSNNGKKISAGKAFDAEVSVLYWLCDPSVSLIRHTSHEVVPRTD